MDVHASFDTKFLKTIKTISKRNWHPDDASCLKCWWMHCLPTLTDVSNNIWRSITQQFQLPRKVRNNKNTIINPWWSDVESHTQISPYTPQQSYCGPKNVRSPHLNEGLATCQELEQHAAYSFNFQKRQVKHSSYHSTAHCWRPENAWTFSSVSWRRINGQTSLIPQTTWPAIGKNRVDENQKEMR